MIADRSPRAYRLRVRIAPDQVDQIARRVVELLRADAGAPAPTYADANNNPLGSARAFLDAHRRGDFPTFKRGREIVARWEDVEAYIASRPTAPRAAALPAPAAIDIDIDKLLAGKARR